jgi:HEAT repeat protein
MPSFLRFDFQFMSFLVGFLTATLFWWVVLFLRAQWPAWRKAMQEQAQTMRESMTASTETRLRNDTLHNTQSMHLAAAFFPLDEILVEPRIMPVPPPANELGSEETSTFMQALPYLPDYPEFAAAFNAPTLSFSGALQSGANLILLGQPGSGKTVALAYLANLFARRDPSLGELANYIPVHIHTADIDLDALESKTPEEILNGSLANHASALTQTRLPKLIQNTLETGEMIILFDGLDEISPEHAHRIVGWIAALRNENPHVRWVVAASPDNFAGLNQLGFIPVSLAAWGKAQRSEFIAKWQQSWLHAFIAPSQLEAAQTQMLLINSWLLSSDIPYTVIEFVLKVWGSYAGDVLGPEATKTLEAHIRRLSVNIPQARAALETLARQMFLTLNPFCLRQEAESWLASYETGTGDTTTQKSSAPSSRIIPLLINNGILTSLPGGRLSFTHPVIFGYLAGSALAKADATNISNMPTWSGKTLALAYAAAFGDLSTLVNDLLASKADPLQQDRLLPIRWLRLAPKNVPWKAIALRNTVTMLQKEAVSLSFGARALAALALTGESGLIAMFRQWLKSDQVMLRYLAILGCGLLNDNKIVSDLAAQTEDEEMPILAQAACLSLSIINDKNARDALISCLLHGNEIIRNTAAEILAYDPEDGAQILQEASQVDDLMVRRAAVFGLGHVQMAWANALLDKIVVEDGQWVVRSAATQAIEAKKKVGKYGIQVPPALHETPWLIDFAAKQGIGVSPGKAAVELLFKALKEGDVSTKVQALEYLRLRGDQNSIVQIYHLLYGDDGDTQEAAYNTLWHIAASGINLPPPVQFGLG